MHTEYYAHACWLAVRRGGRWPCCGAPASAPPLAAALAAASLALYWLSLLWLVAIAVKCSRAWSGLGLRLGLGLGLGLGCSRAWSGLGLRLALGLGLGLGFGLVCSRAVIVGKSGAPHVGAGCTMVSRLGPVKSMAVTWLGSGSRFGLGLG